MTPAMNIDYDYDCDYSVVTHPRARHYDETWDDAKEFGYVMSMSKKYLRAPCLS